MNRFALCRHNNSPDVPARLRESQQSNIANKENDSRSHQALDHRYIEELVAEGKASISVHLVSRRKSDPQNQILFRVYYYYLLVNWKEFTLYL